MLFGCEQRSSTAASGSQPKISTRMSVRRAITTSTRNSAPQAMPQRITTLRKAQSCP